MPDPVFTDPQHDRKFFSVSGQIERTNNPSLDCSFKKHLLNNKKQLKKCMDGHKAVAYAQHKSPPNWEFSLQDTGILWTIFSNRADG